MYDIRYLTIKEICTLLGVGRNTALRICQEKIHDFPAVKVGNRWLAGEFTINE